ncbi:multidrug resistance protein, MATE family [Strigomonas culicis]|uniref:Multidrug resistance protein, MATE family n=2 Tax=Strigomonas culicis TaxID=28005 RepID=S9VPF9_9TRYP|nr:multidrug resistance protein, MATE family [Strigomonas culicis]|eukprot:EPY25135.1 multidrug resistance protein, MATE family [Strigomonas culicis]
MYGIYAQRMCVILLCFAFPLGIILAYADRILSSLGATAEVVHYTGIWCRLSVFGIPATLLYQLLCRYYSCQHNTLPLSVALASAAVANPVMQIAFVNMFGFEGSPIAWLLLMCFIVAGLLTYMWRSGLYKKTWGGWSKKGLEHIGDLLSIALPSMAVMMSEWVALEVNALAGGFTDATSLAGYSITLQIFGIMWGVGSGVMILSCVFVGNAIGEQRPLFARKVAFVAVALMFCISIVDVLIMLLMGPMIPYLFTNDKKVADVYHRLMYIVLPYHFFDTFQSTVMGILRGCGLQKLGAVVICTAFCVVGVPLSFLLFFYFDWGVIALWVGPFIGVVFIGSPVYIYLLLFYIDWANLKPHQDDHAEVAPDEESDTGSDDVNDEVIERRQVIQEEPVRANQRHPKVVQDIADTKRADSPLNPP